MDHICPDCGEELFVHLVTGERITYCPQCGKEAREKRRGGTITFIRPVIPQRAKGVPRKSGREEGAGSIRPSLARGGIRASRGR